jgi:protein phosphatase
MSEQSEIDTVDIPAPVFLPAAAGPQLDPSRVQVELAGASHQGLVRHSNQDHFLIVRFGRLLETLSTNLPADTLPSRSELVGYGMLVADGLGGKAAGDVASSTAISTLYALVTQTPDWIFATADRETGMVMERMAQRYRQVDAALRDQGSADPALKGMATTLTLAVSLGDRAVIGHVGDSRAYLLRDGVLHQLTRDHTLVQLMVELGRLTAEQAATHPYRHVLTQSLGVGEDSVEGDFQRVSLADRDQLLLCTDGLTGMVDDATIASVLGGAASAHDACQELIDLALKNGGRDNVTVALARYRFAT